MALNSDLVKRALQQVIYFKKQNNIVDLNMIHNIEVEGSQVSISVVFPDLLDPSVGIVQNSIVKTLHNEFGEDIVVNVTPVAESELGLGPLSGVKNIIAVISGKGGVGKSTVSANLAVSLSKLGNKVGILDADIMGPSVPIMFDVEQEKPGVIEKEAKPYMLPIEKYGIKILSLGFFVKPEQALMWRGSMINKAFNQLMTEAEWGNLDYLVIDMPPGTGDIQLTLAQSYKIRGTVLVTTPQKIATADVLRAAMMYKQDKLEIPLMGIVENMAWFSPPDMPDKKYYIFGKGESDKLASQIGIPVLGRIPIVEKIVETGDNGKPISLDEDSPVSKAFLDVAASVVKQSTVLNSIGAN